MVEAAFFDFFFVAVVELSAVAEVSPGLESPASAVVVDFFFLVVVLLSVEELSAAEVSSLAAAFLDLFFLVVVLLSAAVELSVA